MNIHPMNAGKNWFMDRMQLATPCLDYSILVGSTHVLLGMRLLIMKRGAR